MVALSHPADCCSSFYPTTRWPGPPCANECRYDARGVDVWCAGIVLFAMTTGKMPFGGGNVDATLEVIRAKEPTYPDHLSAELVVRREPYLVFFLVLVVFCRGGGGLSFVLPYRSILIMGLVVPTIIDY